MSFATGSSNYDPDELFLRAREGDREAWDQLIDACYDKVRRVVRRNLQKPLRSQFDSTDFTNDVFKSLVAKSDRFDFPNMAALVAFLAKSAKDKLVDENRRQSRLKRDFRRDQRFGEREDGGLDEPPSSDPTPSQYAMGRETHETLLESNTGDGRRVIEMKKEGYSNEEVADRMGMSLRKLQRFLKKQSDSWFLRGENHP